MLNLGVGRRAFSTIVIGVFSVTPAFAEESLEDLLVRKGVITTEDLETLKKDEQEGQPAKEEQEGQPAKEEQEAKEAEGELGTNDRVEISASHKGLIIKTRDEKFMFAFGGRLQFDAGLFIQDDTRLGDGTEVRRARIKSYGTVWNDWDYKLEVNFDPDLGVPITDGWLRYLQSQHV